MYKSNTFKENKYFVPDLATSYFPSVSGPADTNLHDALIESMEFTFSFIDPLPF